MSSLIFDYSHILFGRASHFESATFKDEAGLIYGAFSRDNYQHCPHCGSAIRNVKDLGGLLKLSGEPQRSHSWLGLVPRQVHFGLWGCLNCGWWCERVTHSDPGSGGSFISEEGRMGALRAFEPDDTELPLSVLKTELLRRPNVLFDIHSPVFEQLVGDVMSDFYRVKALVIGRAGDRGIDLLLLDGDRQVAIQVKRRQQPEATEPAHVVREFLGAMVTEGFRRGKVVTTAARFSRAAIATRDRAIERNAIDEFELIDARRFHEIFGLSQRGSAQFPWSYRLSAHRREWRRDGLILSPTRRGAGR